jgi:nucleotide-binding universal stress UspA family protein
MTSSPKEEPKDRHFLIAIDETESSKRAVLYVADIIGGMPGFRATLLSVIPEPEEDFFESEAEQVAWTREHLERANVMLENYRQVLIQSGFPPEKVRIRSCVGEGPSLAEAIIDMRCGLSCCTVVVGRHHKSRTEEFLFGSTSNRLVHDAKNCAVWVVE